ncbi:MAG: lysophospholipid acyltransferase family protein [Planctomycetota bacterium]
MTGPGTPNGIIPGAYDPRVARVFGVIVRRMIRGRFHAARLTPGSLDHLDALAQHEGPVVCCLTHAGWWDPMLGMLLHIGRFGPHGRDGIAPIDRDVLQNVGIFKRLGLFGIDPDDPASKAAVVDFAASRLAKGTRPTLWITPQGRFQDPREPMRVRPGVSAILGRLDSEQRGVRVLAVAVEYPFWDDKKPELLAHIAPIDPPPGARSTAAWHRRVSSALPAAADHLAAEAISRDPSRFETLIGGETGGTFFVYDWFLKLTGRDTASIRTRRTP